MMAKGMGLLESVQDIAGEHGLKATKYKIDAVKIVRETEKILREDYTQIPDAPRDSKSESSTEIEDRTTRIIELMTTLVSVLCEWSDRGIVGVAEDCPESLREMARAIFRKTKLLQGGLWTCISCGNIVNVKETKALMCTDCDSSISRSDIHQRFDQMAGRNRTGYGRTSSDEPED
jgi:predicted transcriptional regulator